MKAFRALTEVNNLKGMQRWQKQEEIELKEHLLLMLRRRFFLLQEGHCFFDHGK